MTNFVLVDTARRPSFGTGVNDRAAAGSRPLPQHPARSSNRREDSRAPSRIRGIIGAGEGLADIRCEIIDTSSSGVQIEVSANTDGIGTRVREIPDRCILEMHTYGATSQVSCLVAWRKGRRAGLRFLGPVKKVAVRR